MDPNANLKELLSLAAEIQRDYDGDVNISAENAARLCELVLALDGWISRGGFLPDRWRPE